MPHRCTRQRSDLAVDVCRFGDPAVDGGLGLQFEHARSDRVDVDPEPPALAGRVCGTGRGHEHLAADHANRPRRIPARAGE